MNTHNTTLTIIDSAAARAKVKEAMLVLRALNHQLRRNLLKTILEHNNRITVTEIYKRLLLEQSVASQHLAILRKAGAVKTHRDGKFIFYSVATETIEKIVDLAGDIITESKS